MQAADEALRRAEAGEARAMELEGLLNRALGEAAGLRAGMDALRERDAVREQHIPVAAGRDAVQGWTMVEPSALHQKLWEEQVDDKDTAHFAAAAVNVHSARWMGDGSEGSKRCGLSGGRAYQQVPSAACKILQPSLGIQGGHAIHQACSSPSNFSPSTPPKSARKAAPHSNVKTRLLAVASACFSPLANRISPPEAEEGSSSSSSSSSTMPSNASWDCTEESPCFKNRVDPEAAAASAFMRQVNKADASPCWGQGPSQGEGPLISIEVGPM